MAARKRLERLHGPRKLKTLWPHPPFEPSALRSLARPVFADLFPSCASEITEARLQYNAEFRLKRAPCGLFSAA